jgi:hypothetical protein
MGHIFASELYTHFLLQLYPPLPPMTTAMTNNGNGIAGFVADIGLNTKAAHDADEPTASQQGTTESTTSTKSNTTEPNVEPESYVLLLIDAGSHTVNSSEQHVGYWER